uniref:helix-turn-helix domain-containing protein n=1 Tax=Lachnoclostridium phocaeense TaxID=1871021 RepID=UPI0026DB839D|nr:helix-turn-helix transcriptional regulator [Lachnoclostridium phocaeense]
MAKESKGEYKEFRELLRRGIGTRTQKAFAEEVGISKEHLNRMLNNREINRPTISILRNMAGHMNTITERMLLEACGYEMESIKDRSVRCEATLTDGLKNLVTGDYPQPWRSVTDALQTIALLYMSESGKFEFGKEETNEEEGHHLAEKHMQVSFQWGDGESVCETPVTIYYSRTENGNLIFQDYQVDSTNIRRKRTMAEERLLKAIFGDEDEKMVTTTILGYGFHYTETPGGFPDFLNEHRGAFCTSRDRSQMLLQIIDGGKEPDEIFADFSTDRYGIGTGGAVAEILSKELGILFYCYEHDDELGEEDSPSCIMVDDHDFVRAEISREELLLNLQRAAATLQIPEFGHIYHSYREPAQPQLYDTKSFCYEFK